MLQDKQYKPSAAKVKTYEDNMKILEDTQLALQKLQTAGVPLDDEIKSVQNDISLYKGKYEALNKSLRLSSMVNISAYNAALTALSKIFDAEGTQG